MKAAYSRFPDINILPEEYRKLVLSRLELYLLATLVVAAILLPFSLATFLDTRSHVSGLQAEQERLVAALDQFAPQVQQADKLRQDIANLQANVEKSKNVRDQLRAQQTEWGPLLVPMLVTLPSGIELTSVSKNQKLFTVEGVSRSGFGAIALYYSRLKAAPGVASVTINKTTVVESKDLGTYLAFTLNLEMMNE